MKPEIYELDENGEKKIIKCSGNIFIDLNNGTALELVIDALKTIHTKITLPFFHVLLVKNGMKKKVMRFLQV